jgi:hypothetical protein
VSESGSLVRRRNMTVSIVTDRKRLEKKYGKKGAFMVEKAIDALRGAMENEGIGTRLFLQGGKRSRNAQRGPGLPALLEENDGRSDYLLIIGGDDIVPFCRVLDPNRGSRLDAQWIHCDCYEFFQGHPFAYTGPALGRIPGDASSDPAILTMQIQQAAEAHSQPKPLEEESRCFCAEQWKREATYVFLQWPPSRHTGEVYSSPPVGLRRNRYVSIEIQPEWIGQKAFLLFELHGGADVRSWWGDTCSRDASASPSCLTVVDPALIASAWPKGSLVCAATCWSAYITGKTTQQSNALQLLNRGALGVIGLTHMGYDYTDCPIPNGIDLLFALIIERLGTGAPVGRAVAEGRNRYLSEVANPAPTDEAMVLSLTLLGDPTLRFV